VFANGGAHIPAAQKHLAVCAQAVVRERVAASQRSLVPGITRYGGRITTRGCLSGVRKWKHAQIRIGRKKVKLDLHQENLLSSDLVCVMALDLTLLGMLLGQLF
jgi:hypothetical protein